MTQQDILEGEGYALIAETKILKTTYSLWIHQTNNLGIVTKMITGERVTLPRYTRKLAHSVYKSMIERDIEKILK